jgi:hypothetical protein
MKKSVTHFDHNNSVASAQAFAADIFWRWVYHILFQVGRYQAQFRDQIQANARWDFHFGECGAVEVQNLFARYGAQIKVSELWILWCN